MLKSGVIVKKVNPKCIECANIPVEIWKGKPKPDCYKEPTGKPFHRRSVCSRIRSYYRHHDNNKQKQREGHRYLKYSGDKCALCASVELLEVHHVVPQCKGGLDARFNLVTLCHSCHTTISKYYKAIGWQ